MTNITLPREQHEVLDDLVKLAFDITARPALRSTLRARWAALAAEIGAAIDRPMIDERFVDTEAEMLMQALGRLVDLPGGVETPHYVRWAKIAGVLLPDVHAALARALAAERQSA